MTRRVRADYHKPFGKGDCARLIQAAQALRQGWLDKYEARDIAL